MKLNIGFEELTDYIRRQWNQTLLFQQVSDAELRVAYSRKILIKTIQIPINITFEEANGSVLRLNYSGRLGIDMIMAGALAYARETFPELNQVISVEGRGVRVDLANLKQTKAVFKKISLGEVRVRKDGLEIQASLI